jgi:hypothetical protein
VNSIDRTRTLEAALIGGLFAYDPPALLSSEEFNSLLEVSKGNAQSDIPQLHWERLVASGYALRRLGVLRLTEAGIRRACGR